MQLEYFRITGNLKRRDENILGFLAVASDKAGTKSARYSSDGRKTGSDEAGAMQFRHAQIRANTAMAREEERKGRSWCVGRGVLCWNNLSSGGLYPARGKGDRANWREKQQRFAAMVRPSYSPSQFGREISGMVPGRAKMDARETLAFVWIFEIFRENWTVAERPVKFMPSVNSLRGSVRGLTSRKTAATNANWYQFPIQQDALSEHSSSLPIFFTDEFSGSPESLLLSFFLISLIKTIDIFDFILKLYSIVPRRIISRYFLEFCRIRTINVIFNSTLK